MNKLDPRVYNLFPSSWINIRGNYNMAKFDLIYSYSQEDDIFKPYERVLLEIKCALRYKSLHKLFFNTTYTFRATVPYLESRGYMSGGEYMPTIKGIGLLFLLKKDIPITYDTLTPSYIEDWSMILDKESLFSKFYRLEYYEINRNFIRPNK